MRLIYFSPVCWSSYRQRPHYFVNYFLKHHGCEVLWVNPYPNRLPRIGDFRRRSSLNDQKTERPCGLTETGVPALPIEPIPGGSMINRWLLWRFFLRRVEAFVAQGPCVIGIGRPSRLALMVLLSRSWRLSFLDAMDDFPEFYTGISRRAMQQVELEIARRVDHVLVSSSNLEDKFRRLSTVNPVITLLNALDPTLIRPRWTEPVGRPVLGYIGAISDWFDWDLVTQLASEADWCDVHLVGPVFTRIPRSLPSNLRLFPPCNHDEIDRLLDGFSAGLIPFKVNRLTRGVDPVKFYEYRCKGLPVLTTAFGQMVPRLGEEGVYRLDFDDLSDSVRRALTFRAAPEKLSQWILANSWEYKLDRSGLFTVIPACRSEINCKTT